MKIWRPLKIGGPRRLPSLPNGQTGPASGGFNGDCKKRQQEAYTA